MFLSEGPTGGNTVGTLLADGTLVYRANFSTAGNQNNLEVRSITWPQTTPGGSITNNSPTACSTASRPASTTRPAARATRHPGAARFNGTLFTAWPA